MFRKLLSAVNHCHSLKIAHRDIKPENILITESGDLKLIDFGLSKQVKYKKMKTIVGTPYYIAPEVLTGKYGVKCDIWSLGVIMYILLSGYLPFPGDNIVKVFTKVQDADYNFDQKEWAKVSPEAIDLIKNMLMIDTRKRYNAEMCLNHKWFTNINKNKDDFENNPLDPTIIDNLIQIKGPSRFKKAAMSLFVETLNNTEIEKLRKQFEELDTNDNGQVNATELALALKKSDLSIPEDKIDQIIKEIHDSGDNMINYSEFLTATRKTREFINKDRLAMIFREFEVGESHYIPKDKLEEAFQKLHNPLSDTDIKAIIDSYDKSNTKMISYKEFCKIVLGDDEKLVEFK